jgi:hypothetical protein
LQSHLWIVHSRFDYRLPDSVLKIVARGARQGRSGNRVKADRGWNRPFDDPIPLPKGRQLVTLEDAGTYITRLSRAEHTAPEWQAAMEALILVATVGGPGIMAQTPQDI